MKKDDMKKGFKPLAEMTALIVDPILRKRAGLNIQLLENWPEIVGAEVAEATRPLKMIWPRRPVQDDTFVPATLLVACEGFSAMRLQHESSEVIQRINMFFGFAAIDRLKIRQEPVRLHKSPVPQPRFIEEGQKNRLQHMVAEIQDGVLRRSLFNLGKGILSYNNRKRDKKT